MRRTTLDLPEELWDRVDAERGAVARNRWIRDAIELRLAAHPLDSPDRSARGDGGWSTQVVPAERPVVDAENERPHTLGYPLVDHVWVGVKSTCMRIGCEAPKEPKAHKQRCF